MALLVLEVESYTILDKHPEWTVVEMQGKRLVVRIPEANISQALAKEIGANGDVLSCSLAIADAGSPTGYYAAWYSLKTGEYKFLPSDEFRLVVG